MFVCHYVELTQFDGRFRGRGVGRELIAGAVARAQERGCHPVQLTTDRHRPATRRFYEGFGFVASHQRMKLYLRRAGAGRTRLGTSCDDSPGRCSYSLDQCPRIPPRQTLETGAADAPQTRRAERR